MIGCLSLGLNGHRPFGAALNGHRPPKTGGHLELLQCHQNIETVVTLLTLVIIRIQTI